MMRWSKWSSLTEDKNAVYVQRTINLSRILCPVPVTCALASGSLLSSVNDTGSIQVLYLVSEETTAMISCSMMVTLGGGNVFR